MGVRNFPEVPFRTDFLKIRNFACGERILSSFTRVVKRTLFHLESNFVSIGSVLPKLQPAQKGVRNYPYLQYSFLIRNE